MADGAPQDRVVLVSIKDPNRPRRKAAVPLPPGMSWEDFTGVVCRKLRLRAVQAIYHADSGARVVSLEELQDIDDLMVEEPPAPAPPDNGAEGAEPGLYSDRIGGLINQGAGGGGAEPATILATAVPVGGAEAAAAGGGDPRTPTGAPAPAASAGHDPRPLSARKALWRTASGGGVMIDVAGGGINGGGAPDEEDDSKRDRRTPVGWMPRWLTGANTSSHGLPTSVAPPIPGAEHGRPALVPRRLRRKDIRRLVMLGALLTCFAIMIYLYTRISDLREDGRLGQDMAGVPEPAAE